MEIFDPKGYYKNDLKERLFDFACETIIFLKSLPKEPEVSIIRYQLAKSSTSSGANYEESQAGCSSKADFANKIRIALREMRESNYWLRVIERCYNINADQIKKLSYLINESKELKNILASILNKVA